MVNVSLPPSTIASTGSRRPRFAMSTMPKEPETRRTPDESGSAGPPRRDGPSACSPIRLAHATRRDPHVPNPGGTREGTQEPQEFWCFRGGGAANEPDRRQTLRPPWPVPGGLKVSAVEVFVGNIRQFPASRSGLIAILSPAEFLARHAQSA
jgi:hypothetical protein